METQFYIRFTMKTAHGPVIFAKFFMGDNRDKAYEIYGKLKGTDEVSEKNVLFVDFMEAKENLPLNLKLMTCTLDQLGDNCKIITKELFKSENLEEE